MRNVAWIAVALLVAVAAQAQDPEQPAADPGQTEAETRDTRPVIRVLHDPYDLASFYRSEGRGGYFGGAADRYPIASYYRGGVSGSGYSRFWNSGYGPSRLRPIVSVGARRYDAPQGFDYRSRIGENGDLFLLAPTILAPIGPLSDVFFSVDVR